MSSKLDVVKMSHLMIADFADSEGIALDMTLGHGFDSLELAKHFKHVYAFDIQRDAINSAEHKLAVTRNITIIQDSHENFDQYVKAEIALAIYNLGYLPGGNKTITTRVSTTLSSLDKLLKQLKINGIIIIVVYVGHDEGIKESRAVKNYLDTIAADCFKVATYQIVNRRQAPYLLLVTKVKE